LVCELHTHTHTNGDGTYKHAYKSRRVLIVVVILDGTPLSQRLHTFGHITEIYNKNKTVDQKTFSYIHVTKNAICGNADKQITVDTHITTALLLPLSATG